MSRWQRAEVICAGLVVVLGIAGLLAMWFVPQSTSFSTETINGKLVATHHTSTSLVQSLGFPLTAGILSTFVVLILWVVVTSLVHSRAQAGDALVMEWIGVVFLCVGVMYGILADSISLFPCAVVAIIGVITATVNQWRTEQRRAA